MSDPAQSKANQPDPASSDSGQAEAPLQRAMAEEAARGRKELSEAAFSPSDFGRLATLAGQTRATLAGRGLIPEQGARIEQLEQTLGVLLDEQGNAASGHGVSDGQAYAAGVEVGQLAMIAHALAASPKTWGDRINAVAGETGGADEAALRDRRFRLQFISIVRRAGFRIEPAEPHDAVFELDRWRVGIAAAHLPDEGALDRVIGQAGERLRQGRVPGLVVLEVSALAWPERRLLRVASDRAASTEIHRRVDAFLAASAERAVKAVDSTFAFGLIACATIPSYNVGTRRVAFSTSFRVAALCEADDPRMPRLRGFAKRFGAVRA